MWRTIPAGAIALVVLFVLAISARAQTSGTVGVWQNVTPGNVDLKGGSCGNFGTESVVVDPSRPSDLYSQFNCQGIWKSTDYGLSIWRFRSARASGQVGPRFSIRSRLHKPMRQTRRRPRVPWCQLRP